VATKRDILLQAGRQLGDTSDNFLAEILAPAFDFVLAELTALEAIEAVTRTHTFALQQDVREYETREICRLTPHYPADVLSLRVWTWGIVEGKIRKAIDREYEDQRLIDNPNTRGRWRLWRLYPTHRILQVHPPAGPLENGTDCEIAFIAPWSAIGLDDDVLDIQQEDLECVALGLQVKGAAFSELLQQDRLLTEQKFQAAARRMWGRRWVRAGRIPLRR
jgi:hypothetical protein